MNEEITPIIIEKETVSDNLYTIVEVHHRDGDEVHDGDVVMAVETSKAVVDVESPCHGYIFYNAAEGEEIAVGAVCAAISSSLQMPENYFDRFSDRAVDAVEDSLAVYDAHDIAISKAAKKLLKEHDLEPYLFKGRTILRTEDIYEYLKSINSDMNIVEEGDTQSKNRLIIIGGGGHAKMCIDIIRQMKTYEIAGIIDSSLDVGATTLDVPVLGGDEDLEKLYREGIKFAVIGFGALHQPNIRQKMYQELKSIGYLLPNVIHPSAILEPSVDLGEGNQIMAGAILGSDVRLGNNNIVNSGCIVCHDSILHDNAHITPGAILAGTVEVGTNTIVGMGATVLLNVKIGSDVIVLNGMNVIKDVPDGTVLKK